MPPASASALMSVGQGAYPRANRSSLSGRRCFTASRPQSARTSTTYDDIGFIGLRAREREASPKSDLQGDVQRNHAQLLDAQARDLQALHAAASLWIRGDSPAGTRLVNDRNLRVAPA